MANEKKTKDDVIEFEGVIKEVYQGGHFLVEVESGDNGDGIQLLQPLGGSEACRRALRSRSTFPNPPPGTENRAPIAEVLEVPGIWRVRVWSVA